MSLCSLSRFDCSVAAVFSPHTPYCVMCVGVASELSHSRMVGAPKSKREIAMHGGREREKRHTYHAFCPHFCQNTPYLSQIKGAGPIILPGAVNYLTLPNSLGPLSAVPSASVRPL